MVGDRALDDDNGASFGELDITLFTSTINHGASRDTWVANAGRAQDVLHVGAQEDVQDSADIPSLVGW